MLGQSDKSSTRHNPWGRMLQRGKNRALKQRCKIYSPFAKHYGISETSARNGVNIENLRLTFLIISSLNLAFSSGVLTYVVYLNNPE